MLGCYNELVENFEKMMRVSYIAGVQCFNKLENVMRDRSLEDKTLLVISNAETFNKYLLTVSTSAFPALWYLISKSYGFLLGYKIALALFGLAIFLNMLSLIIIIDDPDPKGCKGKFIYCCDWIAFILFAVALTLTYFSMIIL